MKIHKAKTAVVHKRAPGYKWLLKCGIFWGCTYFGGPHGVEPGIVKEFPDLYIKSTTRWDRTTCKNCLRTKGK